jgi:SAM-dependent methyltransferase
MSSQIVKHILDEVVEVHRFGLLVLRNGSFNLFTEVSIKPQAGFINLTHEDVVLRNSVDAHCISPNVKLINTSNTTIDIGPHSAFCKELKLVSSSPDSPAGPFDEIYKNNTWGNGSVPGSNQNGCQQYLLFLKFIGRGRHILDVGCGDMQLYRDVDITEIFKAYTGVDVVRSVIVQNRESYSPIVRGVDYKIQQVNFIHGDIHTAFCADHEDNHYDLVVVKDVLNHLPNADIEQLLGQIRETLLTAVITQDYAPSLPTNNINIQAGDHRPLALMQAPFNIREDRNYEVVFWFNWLCSTEGRFKQTIVYGPRLKRVGSMPEPKI